MQLVQLALNHSKNGTLEMAGQAQYLKLIAILGSKLLAKEKRKSSRKSGCLRRYQAWVSPRRSKKELPGRVYAKERN
jgi:hypothetical protein